MTVRNAVGLAFTLYWLVVRLDVEVDEEAEVAREQHASEDSSAFGARARSEMREEVVVAGHIVVVRYVSLYLAEIYGISTRYSLAK